MGVKLNRQTLSLSWCKVNAFSLIPEGDLKDQWAIFAHGYTANKNDCLNWAVRLAEAGVPSMIFDWPGHYLGSFNDISSFDEFKDHFHELFGEAYELLGNLTGKKCETLILGGHSLGALGALKALELFKLKNVEKLAVLVGMGLNTTAETHVFDSSFYQKTLSIRRQLVSPCLDTDVVFPWIRKEKENLTIRGQRIHLIVGADDVVVGPGGMENLKNILEKLGNSVTSYEPNRMAHHEPGNASPHIHAFLKSHFGWK